jgi:indole-3-glycerol phosphate synthase
MNNTYNILDKIVEQKKIRLNEAKKYTNFKKIKEHALNMNVSNKFSFEKSLSQKNISFICEVKKASPSKGLIVENFNHVEIAVDYKRAGADAISILTEIDNFKGCNQFLIDIKREVDIPLLRKDFIIDEYQIYESKVIGADCILLICSILDDKQLNDFYKIATALNMSVLVETHDEYEIERALKIKSKIIGVNNRNLKTFDVDINNSIKLRKLVDNNIIFVSESGIKTREDVENLENNNINAVLIGEGIINQNDKALALKKLRNQ